MKHLNEERDRKEFYLIWSNTILILTCTRLYFVRVTLAIFIYCCAILSIYINTSNCDFRKAMHTTIVDSHVMRQFTGINTY